MPNVAIIFSFAMKNSYLRNRLQKNEIQNNLAAIWVHLWTARIANFFVRQYIIRQGSTFYRQPIWSWLSLNWAESQTSMKYWLPKVALVITIHNTDTKLFNRFSNKNWFHYLKLLVIVKLRIVDTSTITFEMQIYFSGAAHGIRIIAIVIVRFPFYLN